MYFMQEKKLSHKKWRSFLKIERRRMKRRKLATLRDHEKEKELAILMSNPAYRAWIEEQEVLAETARIMEEESVQKRREEWIAKDLVLHKSWIENQKKKRRLEEEKRLQEERIRREWEEAERKEEEDREKKKKAQEALLLESTRGFGQGEATHNPDPPPGYPQQYTEKKIEPCPFFLKTGVCRFGLQCSRAHDYPMSSRTLLLANMYGHLGLDGDATDDYDMDLSLEYTDTDRYNHFRDFYFDVLPEFEKCGRITQFKVCCNKSPHLKGNVYVQYERMKAAETAIVMFNGRWYAGKQISCIFVPVERWKPAICGLHWSHKCPKGNNCNFLHVYRNPGNTFYKADKDCYDADNYSNTINTRGNRKSHRINCGSRSRSRERGESSRSHRRRSRSTERELKSSSSRSRNKSRRRSERSYSSSSCGSPRERKKDRKHKLQNHSREEPKHRTPSRDGSSRSSGSSTKSSRRASCSSRNEDKSRSRGITTR